MEEFLPVPEQSKATFVANTKLPVSLTHFVKAGLLISTSSQEDVAVVLQLFSIQLSTVEGGYIATSPISDLYELGMSVPNVVRNYLYSLADELIWLQNKKDDLSLPLLHQLENIQSYISVI